MSRTRFIAGCGLSLWAAASFVAVSMPSPLRQTAHASTPILGEGVDTDTPATYRLPQVSSFAPMPITTSASSREVALPPPPPNALRVANRHRIDAAGNVMPAAGALVPDIEALRYAPTTAELTSQLLPAVQRGYGLAQRGALYAAQAEFVQVLRRVAQAKDAAASGEEHSRALAAGLRALDEAKDFVPRGLQLEGEVNVWIVASSHRTPVLQAQAENHSLHKAASLYHAFAERQLAYAVAGEQAGSMALHGLGKITARLAELGDDDVQHVRTAMVMFSAALAARPDNHLAANELGVLLCRNGRPVEAARQFERTIDFAPSATAYHNLAVAQRKLGMQGPATANEQESQRLAAWERNTGAVSRRAGVAWVAPADMARVAQPGPLTPKAVVPEEPQKSPWRKTFELAKSLPLPGVGHRKDEQSQTAGAALPFGAPPLPNQSQLR
jgi:tetratricopeptide (TPR) repeat protein